MSAFLRCITGCKEFTGRPIYVNFHDDPDQPAFTISTCGSQIEISKLLEVDEVGFVTAVKALIDGSDFNMP